MQRYNIFYQIHKGLRQMLYQTAGNMLQVDFSNNKEASQMNNQIAAVLDLFDEHAHTEDNFVLPSIGAFEPIAVSSFEEEHVEDHALGNRLRALLNMFHHAVSSEEKNEMGSAIRFAFTEFLVFNLEHMAKEEGYLNQLLWKYYTDKQLHDITGNILANVPQDKMGQYNMWMMRALSNNEIAGWLLQVKQQAPDFVFTGLSVLAEKELPAERWEAILESMPQEELLASA